MKKHALSIILFVAANLLALINANAQKWGDYTFYSIQNSTSAVLIDTNNNVHHTWTFGSTAKTGYSSYLLSGGVVLRTVAHQGNTFTGGGMTGEVQKVDWNNNVLWDYIYSTTTYCMHHDVCAMPNGNVLIISYELKTAAEVTQAGSSTSHTMWPDKIIEVQPSGTTGGTIVWEWHAWDHLCQNANAAKDNYYTSIVNHPELLNINYNNTISVTDWMHTNGLDYNVQLDQIAFSSHNLNEIYVIDHSTTTAQAASHAGGSSGKGGDILYRWGNPAAYGAGTTSNQVLKVVHDAHWVPQNCPKAGYLVGFNNNGISTNQSCVDMINPPLSGNTYSITIGSAFTPANYNWRHACNGHANDMSNSQQLPNGNTLVCVAQSGTLYEIDSNQNTVWSKTVTGVVPQAFRYTACYVSGTAPATPSITQTGSSLNSSTGVTYQWYYNGNAISGATSSSYLPTQNGNYQVQVLDSNKCASQLSALFNYTATGIDDVNNNNDFNIYPNPTSGLIHINSLLSDYNVLVSDAYGKLLVNTKNATQIDCSAYANGVYFITIKTESGRYTQKVVVAK